MMADPVKKDRNGEHRRTRERILDEAEALFAIKGYHAVSVREITRAAGCNLAAVNYHFGNKHNLYLEVFRSRWLPRADRIHTCFRRLLATEGTASTDAVLRSLASAFLEGPLTDEERKCHHRLISGEMAQPTEAFEMVAEKAFRPLFESLFSDLRATAPGAIEKERLALSIFSIFAMVLYFNFARPLISEIIGRPYGPEFRSRLVNHLVDFSLNGLGGSRKEDTR